MLTFGFGLGMSYLNVAKTTIFYKDSMLLAKPAAVAIPLGFEGYGIYNFKNTPISVGLNISYMTGSINERWNNGGFSFVNTTKANITYVKLLIGSSYEYEGSFRFDVALAPGFLSLSLNGDNGHSNGNSWGFGLLGNFLFEATNQLSLGLGLFFDYVGSVKTTFSGDPNVKVIADENKFIGFNFKVVYQR
jgi:hypothetical protein